jgi:hypothetical protein
MKTKGELEDEDDDDVEEDYPQIQIEDLLSELKIHDKRPENDDEESNNDEEYTLEETKK